MSSYTSSRPFPSDDYFRGHFKTNFGKFNIITTLSGEGVDCQGLSGMTLA